ncbi:MAG: exodeoxyribonuclease VII small subunit [Candidatus Methanomethylophilaceae archaeon]|jgi:exodeoxyribonuclease VII small subunit|nr:exodeoxyribonuclease VII small subunit [Thermoplasmata archaeon]MBO4348648.1 exodeoxyribonuclease VII small subunit [Candidatus Methanomethylophilaceae archaeon]MBR3475791.1 exodeoxyribonuclease VII small subunit [Candidatus Methanomethylophilaceae archaeon]MBR4181892.1 exodeoxyribonuclease VII small subunit [Candidatus Methanomethylophilaceae archaeon]MBR6871318.1 exodeoxyribonuclease VII small subunit [Candidatus Methanomethylophilaceae archaeon]
MNEEESAKFAEEVSKMSFEESIQQLESLVEKLEAGGTDLDQSLEIYEKAVVLRNHCKEVLDDGQRRIKKILETSNGITETDFQ